MFHSFIFLRRISYFLLNKMLFVSFGEVWLIMINSWLWLIAVFLLFPAKSFFLFFSRKKLSPLTKTFAQVKRLSAPLLFTAKVCKVGSSRTDEVSGQFSIENLWPRPYRPLAREISGQRACVFGFGQRKFSLEISFLFRKFPIYLWQKAFT